METCPTCLKETELCLCGTVTALDNRVEVLILQHPQEPDKQLGTARLATMVLRRSVLRTGFSVPNLAAALGHPADPAEWIVLYLGSKYKFEDGCADHELGDQPELLFFDRDDQPVSMDRSRIKGVVAIDGTWAQAKALWWRNPWLLKLRRAVVLPKRPSLYGKLRREPRRECVSTIEAVAATLEALGEAAAVPEALRGAFAQLIGRYQARLDRGTGQPDGAAGPGSPAAGSGGAGAADRPPTRAEKAAAARKAALEAQAAAEGPGPAGPGGA
jgi:DTW domain-containing protein YfiP